MRLRFFEFQSKVGFSTLFVLILDESVVRKFSEKWIKWKKASSDSLTVVLKAFKDTRQLP